MALTTPGSVDTFKRRFLADRPGEAGFAEQVIAWAMSRHLVRKWSSAAAMDTLTCQATIGQYKHKILALQTNGLIWILFDQLLSGFPSGDATVKARFHKQLADRLGKIPGGNSLPTAYKSKASWRLSDMNVPAFLGVADWMLSDLQKTHEATVALHASNRTRHLGR